MARNEENPIDSARDNHNEADIPKNTESDQIDIRDEDFELFFGSSDSKDESEFRFPQLEKISKHEICHAFRVFDPATGLMNFHKKYILTGLSKEAIIEFNREEEVLRVLETNNRAVSPKLISVDHKKLEIKFEGGEATVLEVHRLMEQNKIEWREEDLVYIFQGLAEQLKEIQSFGIVHGDIKPQNIVFVAIKPRKYQIRLVNFAGFQQHLSKDISKSYQVMPHESTHAFMFPVHQPQLSWMDNNSPPFSPFAEMYQVAKTILFLMCVNPQQFFEAHDQGRRNNSIEGLEQLANEKMEKYYFICPIIIKILKNRTEHQKMKLGSSYRFYSLGELLKDLQQTLSASSNLASSNAKYCFHDHQELISNITDRRRKESAWNTHMPIQSFKLEILYSYKLGEFQRGIALCNYLIGFENEPESHYLLNSKGEVSNSKVFQPRPPGEKSKDNPKPVYLFKERSLQKRSKPQKFVNPKHEMLILTEYACKDIFSSDLQECLPIYFFIKEQLALFFKRLGYLEESQKIILSLLSELSEEDRKQTIRYARIQRILGEVYAKKKDYIQAEHYLRIENSIFQGNSLLNIEAAMTLISLSEIYCKLDNPKSALNSAGNACDVIRRILPNSLQFAEVMIRAGAVFNHCQDSRALRVTMEGYSVLKQIFSKNNIYSDYLDEPLFRIAILQGTNNKTDDQINSLYQLLKIRSTRTPESHPHIPPQQLQLHIAQAHTELGNAYLHKQHPDNALVHYRNIRREILGEWDTLVADSISNISDALRMKRDFKQCLQLRLFVRKIQKKKSPWSIGVAISHDKLVEVYQDLHNFDKAVTEHQASIALKTRIFRQKSIPVGVGYLRFGQMYLRNKDPSSALPQLEKAKDILIHECHQRDPVLFESLHSLREAQLQKHLKPEASQTHKIIKTLQDSHHEQSTQHLASDHDSPRSPTKQQQRTYNHHPQTRPETLQNSFSIHSNHMDSSNVSFLR